MLTKITKIWNEFKLAIIAAAIAVVYFIGIKRGKDDQTARNNKKTLANMSKAATARAGLRNDPDAVRRLHNKYRRK